MKVEKDRVVVFHYELTEVGEADSADAPIENSRDDEPVAYIHGHDGNIIDGLQTEMDGKTEGDQFSVTLTPEQAYGERKSDAQQRVPIKHLVEKKTKLRVGQTVSVNTANGPVQVQILKVGKFNVDVDVNHPFAGMTLRFDVEIQEVREATQEELAHGHAHGIGGHQH